MTLSNLIKTLAISTKISICEKANWETSHLAWAVHDERTVFIFQSVWALFPEARQRCLRWRFRVNGAFAYRFKCEDGAFNESEKVNHLQLRFAPTVPSSTCFLVNALSLSVLQTIKRLSASSAPWCSTAWPVLPITWSRTKTWTPTSWTPLCRRWWWPPSNEI